MSPELASDVINIIGKSLTHVETISLHFYGGEPLLNLDAMRAMVDHAHRSGNSNRFEFAITTNGTILTDEVIDIMNAGQFNVILSIDGPAEIHDECRKDINGRPSHEKVVNFLNALRSKTNCHIRGSSVVRRGWSLSNAEKYLRSLPVDTIKAQAIRVPDDHPYALSKKEKQKYFADLDDLGNTVIDEIHKGIFPRDDRFSARVLQLLKGGARERFCGAGYSIFGIFPNGDVAPCVLLDPHEYKLGNILDNPASWVEKGKEFYKIALRSECANCRCLPLCGGGCSAILPVCGADECELTMKNCEIADKIYNEFKTDPEKLLVLAGIL